MYAALIPPRSPEPVYVSPRAAAPPPTTTSVPPLLDGPPLQRAVDKQDAAGSAACIATNHEFPGPPGQCATAAPATVLSTTGTPGKNSWLVSPVTVTLTAMDASGAGINRTEDSYGSEPFNV